MSNIGLMIHPATESEGFYEVEEDSVVVLQITENGKHAEEDTFSLKIERVKKEALQPIPRQNNTWKFDTTGLQPGTYEVSVTKEKQKQAI